MSTTMTYNRHSLGTAPERSLAQRLDALERANEVRSARAKIKHDLKARRRTFAEVLADPPAEVETAHVFDMLLTVPKVGRVKAGKILRECRISPSKTMGGLSDRQRDDLTAELARRADRVPS